MWQQTPKALAAIALLGAMGFMLPAQVTAQYAPYQPPPPSAAPSESPEEVCGPEAGQSPCYYIYLANFSTGRAEFFLSPRRVWFVWQVGQEVKKVCDLASQSFFAPTTLFPQNACRIKVDVTHEWWLDARVWYKGGVQSGPNVVPLPRAYVTPKVHLPPDGARPGSIYEYDACGETGQGIVNCGWREIIQQDRKY